MKDILLYDQNNEVLYKAASNIQSIREAVVAAIKAGVRLVGVVLQDADLRGVDFAKCDLTAANFKGADLEGANFNKAELTSVSFDNAYLAGASFVRAHFRDTIFSGATCSKANFTYSRGEWPQFKNADLQECLFTGANLWGANIEGAVLSGAVFSGAVLKNLKARSVEGANILFRGCYLGDADLARANFSNCDFEAAILGGANMEKAIIDNCNMTSAYMESLYFVRGRLTNSNLSGSTCDYADFTEARLEKVAFVAAELGGAIMAKAHIEDCSFADAKTNNIILREAKIMNTTGLTQRGGANIGDSQGTEGTQVGPVLVKIDGEELYRGEAGADIKQVLEEALRAGVDLMGVNLKGAALSKVDLMDADLTGADLTGADLTAANLSGAILDEALCGEANFAGATLRYASLRHVQGDRAVFTLTDAAEADFAYARLQGANFRDAFLKDANFNNCDLAQATFEGANMSDSLMQDATLNKTDMRNANCSFADFHTASLEDVNFAGADLDEVNFRKATIINCDFSGASYEKADTRGAVIQNAVGFVRVNDSAARSAFIFPASSPDVSDGRGHFPIPDVAHARNAIARVNQYTALPTWYAGDKNLRGLVEQVVEAVKAKFPSINVGADAYKPAPQQLADAAPEYGIWREDRGQWFSRWNEGKPVYTYHEAQAARYANAEQAQPTAKRLLNAEVRPLSLAPEDIDMLAAAKVPTDEVKAVLRKFYEAKSGDVASLRDKGGKELAAFAVDQNGTPLYSFKQKAWAPLYDSAAGMTTMKDIGSNRPAMLRYKLGDSVLYSRAALMTPPAWVADEAVWAAAADTVNKRSEEMPLLEVVAEYKKRGGRKKY